jgi:predicted phosphodiesterase
MNQVKGVFLSDVHLPYQINLKPLFQYLKDLQPDQIVLGGDILDGPDHGVDGWTMEQVEKRGFECYDRDVKLIKEFVASLHKAAPKAKIVYLEGNHEERYMRLVRRYPNALKARFRLWDAVPGVKWIPYGDYDSFYKVGDMLFTHGTIFPDAHSKKMAMAYLPDKVCYGHIHDFQSYTTHNGDPRKPGRYAVTAGCLCGRLPDYKKGHPNKWVNGFVSWTSVNGTTSAVPVLIESWGFAVGNKLYLQGK